MAAPDLRASMPVRVRDPDALFDLAPGDLVLLCAVKGTAPWAYSYGCPGCGARCIMHLGEGPPGHTWHVTAGDASHPDGVTVRASVLHAPQYGGCGWHGYLTAGRWVPC